jgi:ribosome biogenesis protein MAK21
MQPLAGSDRHDLLVTAGGMSGKSRTQEPLNSDAFWRRHVEDVAAEDVFFHEYFNRLGKDKKSKKEPKTARKDAVMRDEEAGHEDSDAESEIWQALVESRPELEGDDDSDDDLDLDDLESAFDDEDDVDANEPVDDDDVIFNDESDESDDAAEADSDVVVGDKSRAAASDEDGEDAFDMDVSDEEAFRDSDEDLPSDLDVGGVDGVIPPLAAAEKDDKAGRKKRRKLSHLPTFASVDDYAALLADDDEGLM